jgi:hypothetical protein
MAVIANNLYLHHLIDDSGFTALTGTPPPARDTADTGSGTPAANGADDMKRTY